MYNFFGCKPGANQIKLFNLNQLFSPAILSAKLDTLVLQSEDVFEMMKVKVIVSIGNLN